MIANDRIPKTPEEIRQVIKRAEGGDAKALPALRKLLEMPDIVDMCGGDLAQQAERSLINTAAGNNLSFKEAMIRKTEILRKDLAGPSPTPLERLLVERIVTCWLHLHDVQVRFVQAKGLSIPQADYHHRAIDHCHRRYLTAIKTLATVRKLALPVLQVNIAKKQVNVGQVNSGSETCRAENG
jgi:hypothetical protein